VNKNNRYILKYNPITPSLRHTCLVNKRLLNNKLLNNNLLLSISSNSGRNNHGNITVRHKGGGYRKLYRKIDFLRNIVNIPASIYSVEYDPNRSSFISLIFYSNGTLLHNIELVPGKGGLFSRSAGTHGILINGDQFTTSIKLSSGLVKNLSSYCRATIGIVSNEWYRYVNLGKAGRSRWL